MHRAAQRRRGERQIYKIQHYLETTKRAANAMHNAFSSLEWSEREKCSIDAPHNNRAGRTVNPSIFHLNGTLMMKRRLICLQSGEQIHLQHFSSRNIGENAHARTHALKERLSLSLARDNKILFCGSELRACVHYNGNTRINEIDIIWHKSHHAAPPHML